ncbi:TFIIB-type zinc ribbon-containing protein [Novilysobacter erysipheiresistens]|uniref:Zf-TFIIB domain-containing protein n=1 Tax=Novilysobacter erysipheiresistens TaxID=1749332 RepID=A0ABU7YX11_9GAMM
MDCPVCNDVKLAMSDRQGIEIDYCPQCRGVWLDRGELDKLIERASVEMAPPPPPPQATRPPPLEQPRYEQPRYDKRDSDYYRHKKKKNLLGELFDF